MPLAHPVILRNLVERHQALSRQYSVDGAPAIRRELDTVAQLLCVATGTDDVCSALAAAAHGVRDAGPQGGPRCEAVPGAAGS
ncbi:DUF5133 domain-containing protein [Streptomyces sp. NPDC051320]|uniref:DUF5133 domain-containing protein n=1 Tax=Streptomyces sp. NPDC051320 TaxID=3154644 RepID=UPI0034258798